MNGADLGALPRAHTDLAPLGGRWHDATADFTVTELLEAPRPGRGWRWLWTERCGMTTDEVAARIAAAAGVAAADVRWSGRKDRAACVRQWFALPEAAPPPRVAGLHIVAEATTDLVLRRDQHRGNRFVVDLRGSASDGERIAAWQARLQTGFPNYFGPQRFGSAGDNAVLGARVLRGELRVAEPRRRELLLHAWQAALFNATLAEWLAAGRPSDPGDLVWHEAAATALPRAALPAGIATGPLFGAKMPWPRGAAAAREARHLETAGYRRETLEPLAARVRLFGARRPFWTVPAALTMTIVEDRLRVEFELPPGAYASVLVREISGDPSGRRAGADRP